MLGLPTIKNRDGERVKIVFQPLGFKKYAIIKLALEAGFPREGGGKALSS